MTTTHSNTIGLSSNVTVEPRVIGLLAPPSLLGTVDGRELGCEVMPSANSRSRLILRCCTSTCGHSPTTVDRRSIVDCSNIGTNC